MKARLIDPRNVRSLSETPVTLWRSDRAQREFDPFWGPPFPLQKQPDSLLVRHKQRNQLRVFRAAFPRWTAQGAMWDRPSPFVACRIQEGGSGLASRQGYMGGSARLPPGEKAQKILRAIDIQTGKIAWDLPEAGPGESWGGASPKNGCPDPAWRNAVEKYKVDPSHVAERPIKDWPNPSTAVRSVAAITETIEREPVAAIYPFQRPTISHRNYTTSYADI